MITFLITLISTNPYVCRLSFVWMNVYLTSYVMWCFLLLSKLYVLVLSCFFFLFRASRNGRWRVRVWAIFSFVKCVIIKVIRCFQYKWMYKLFKKLIYSKFVFLFNLAVPAEVLFDECKKISALFQLSYDKFTVYLWHIWFALPYN